MGKIFLEPRQLEQLVSTVELYRAELTPSIDGMSLGVRLPVFLEDEENVPKDFEKTPLYLRFHLAYLQFLKPHISSNPSKDMSTNQISTNPNVQNE